MKIQELLKDDLATYSEQELILLASYFGVGVETADRDHFLRKLAHYVFRTALQSVSLYNYQDKAFHEKWYNYIKYPFNLSESSWLRYAVKCEQRTTKSGQKLWVATMPKGFRIYHGSKVLPLAHAEFPVKEPNCPNEIPSKLSDVWKMNACTTMSYYAYPPDIAYYAAPQDPMKLLPHILEAYGHPSLDEDNREFGRKYGQDLGSLTIASYQLKADTDFMILALDQLSDPTATFGKENSTVFLGWLREKGYPEWLYELAQFCLGDLPLIKQYSVFRKWLQGTGRTSVIQSWLRAEKEILSNMEIPTTNSWEGVMTISSLYALRDRFPEEFSKWERERDPKILERVPGFRWSTFEIDRAVFNALLQFVREQVPEVKGYISDNIQRPQGVCGGNELIECQIQSGNLSNVKRANSYLYNFHRELTLWYAPDHLIRTPENPFDSRFGWNLNEIIDEMRKYKTMNLMPKGFHQGHLAEHSIWTALYVEEWLANPLFIDLNEHRNTLVLAALLHDIGKMGECTVEYGFKQMDTTQLTTSSCHNKGTHFRYNEIPDHPLRGYLYLTGRLKMKQYGLNLKEYTELGEETWNDFFEYFALSEFEVKMLRVIVGIHWELGPTITAKKFSPVEYINKFEMFYHSEFGEDNSTRTTVLKACSLVSIADILGSEAFRYLSKESTRVEMCDYERCKDWVKRWLSDMNPIVPGAPKAVIKAVLENVERCRELWVVPQQTSVENNVSTYLSYLEAPIDKFLDNILIGFDIDQTLLLWKGQSYKWISGKDRLIQDLQRWRPRVKLAIASRHYRPKLLEKWLKENHLIEMFDYIVVQYTGIEKHLQGFFYKAGKKVDLHFEAQQLLNRNKVFHFNLLKSWEPKRNMLLVDDDKAILGSSGVSGVIAVDDRGQHSLSVELLEKAIKILAYKRDHFASQV